MNETHRQLDGNNNHDESYPKLRPLAVRPLLHEEEPYLLLRDPQQLFGKYPHELSGGMLQRIITSFAIALKPELIIADEPTTAIDYISQREVIKELQSIRDLFQTSIIFISHDLSLVSHIADRVLVVRGGKIVKELQADEASEENVMRYAVGAGANHQTSNPGTQP